MLYIGKYISLCQGDPIGAGIFVAITWPPEIKEIILKSLSIGIFVQTVKRDNV